MATAYDKVYVDDSGCEHRYQQHDHSEDGSEVECAYCGMFVPGCESCPNAPPVDDEEVWQELAEQHADDCECEWIRTRAHRLT